MYWLNKIVDEIEQRHPEGELLIESGASPSGTYHVGHLREIVTCDAILLELKKRGRQASHVQFVDDLDGLRKIAVNIPADYEQYLGMPLCDIPAPDKSDQSYGQYFLNGLTDSAKALGIEMEVLYAHEKYRAGYFVPAIERSLQRLEAAKQTLNEISGRQLDEHWSPIQIMENGRLKNRRFLSLDTDNKEIHYKDSEGQEQVTGYDKGQVKLDWRLDWPGRWWLMQVDVEPFGRDHATKGGSFDTGVSIMEKVYEAQPPLPVPYDFINRAGDTKKMSASKGTGVAAYEAVQILPPEILRYFILQYPPEKRLYFDAEGGVAKLIDEFAELLGKPNKSEDEQALLRVSLGSNQPTISSVPFTHLVASFQAALRDEQKTLEIMSRTEYAEAVKNESVVIKKELQFVANWLDKWAPDDVRFDLLKTVNAADFTDQEVQALKLLGSKIAEAPADADGEWFHKALYDVKEAANMQPKELFSALYRCLIGKTSGPRAGWFLSILPRDWLIARLQLID